MKKAEQNLHTELSHRMKRYERLAELLAAPIRQGQIAAGARLPSVRQLMAQHQVSASTAFMAYARLEDLGLVRARERSGYFVAGSGLHRLAVPRPRPASRQPGPVNVSDLVFSVLGAMQDPGLLPLGSAFPAAELFPLARLGRSLAAAARHLAPGQPLAALPQGHAGLRQQIAQRYLVQGLPQPAEDIVVTNGALEALNLCLSAVAGPGDLIAVESPGFYAALQAIERLKMRAIEIPVDPREGLDLAALAQALQRHPIKACWFMTSFQNPMGASMDEGRKQELVRLLTRHQVPLIEDDVYGELYFGPRCPLPAKAFDTQGWVMHCGSFSKTLAPGFRVGWVSAGRFRERVERLRLMTTLGASLPAQMALADYLQQGGYDRHLRRLRHALELQQSAMLAALARHFPVGLRVSRPGGGYFLWLEFPKGFDTLALHHAALAQGIGLAPGPIFSARGGFRHGLRLNHGHPWGPASEAGLARLGQLVAQAMGGA